MSEIDPLVERVDALLKRHQQPTPSPAIPAASPLEAPPPFEEPAAAQTAPEPQAAVESDEDDIPVLTEIVETGALASFAAVELAVESAVAPADGAPASPFIPAPPPAFDEKALVAQIESAVLDKLRVELDRSLPLKLNRAIGDMLDQALDGLRADLSATVRQTVRVAVEKALEERPDQRSSASRESSADS